MVVCIMNIGHLRSFVVRIHAVCSCCSKKTCCLRSFAVVFSMNRGICSCLWLFVVVCSGLQWFAVVCGINKGHFRVFALVSGSFW